MSQISLSLELRLQFLIENGRYTQCYQTALTTYSTFRQNVLNHNLFDYMKTFQVFFVCLVVFYFFFSYIATLKISSTPSYLTPRYRYFKADKMKYITLCTDGSINTNIDSGFICEFLRTIFISFLLLPSFVYFFYTDSLFSSCSKRCGANWSF